MAGNFEGDCSEVGTHAQLEKVERKRAFHG